MTESSICFNLLPSCNIEAVALRCSVKKVPQACNFIKKETLAHVFSCKFCQISKNIFLHRAPLVAASGNVAKLHTLTAIN